jgi:ABC-2 type transport system permease protein
MKFWTIFRYEFGYQLRTMSTWFNLAILFAFTLVMNLLVKPGDGVYANSTFNVFAITVIGGLIWIVIGASIAGEAAARDVKTRMHNLTYTIPVTKFDYLGGRFFAVFVINALLILSLPLGVFLSFFLPGIEQEDLGPFRASAYLNAYFYIALPNVFITTAFQFGFASISRRVMTSYVASLLLAIVAQIIAGVAAKLFGNWDLVKLLDPIGVSGIVGSELGTWTATEKNTRLITLEGMFLWNRLLWLGVATGILLFTYFRFNFANVEPGQKPNFYKRWRKRQAKPSPGVAILSATRISVPHIHRPFGAATYFRQALTIAWASFRMISRNPVGLSLVGVIALVSAVFGAEIMTQFGIPLIPTTQQVLSYFAVPVGNIVSPWVIIPLLLIYITGELVWHERDAGLSDIIDATPVPEWIFVTGKFFGSALIIMVWMTFLMIGGILMQISMDYHHFEMGLYLQILFGLQLLDYLLFALLALVVHVMVNQKYISYAVMFLVFSFIAFPETFGVEHNMLIFGEGPRWAYTDMRGFGSTIWPWLCLKLYWIGFGLLLAIIAGLLWPRGRQQSLKYRVQSAQRRFTKTTALAGMIAAGVILTLGSYIFYNTNVLNEYLTSSDINERKAGYELRYGQYRNSPQPQLTDTKLHVDIYPGRRQVEIRAAYTLVNKNTVPIDSIHIGNVSGIAPDEVSFNRTAAAVLIDKERCHNIYALKQPLQPGDSLQVKFVVHYRQRGFSNSGSNTLVVKDGSYFTNYDLLPAIGYQSYRELNDAVLRKKYKLAARPALPSLYDREARKKPAITDQNRFEAIISTVKDEVAVAPGILQQTWTKGNRRYFHFKTDAPIRGEYSILSGKYLVRESKWEDVAISIYFHPVHAMNIDRMLRSVKSSLEYYTEQFGPNPYKHLTVVEHAGPGGGASSEAGMIDYGEQYALMNPDDSPDGFDLPYYILAHEVAHQWWGGAGLTPAWVEGAGVLVEGLAVYSGMQVLEKDYGDGHLQQYVNYLHSFYDMPRSLATASLLQANEKFLYYRKGGLAMYVLSKYIGKEKVNGALRSLLQKHHSGELPLPSTLDLYQELQKVTPDSLNYLLHDLFKENTYWRLKTKRFVAKQIKAGHWQATIKVQAQKVVVDATGKEKEIPMNDWLEIGIYEQGKEPGKPLYLQKHRIRSGEQTINVTLQKKPGSGGIDPNGLMIDLRRDDNMMKAEEAK